MARFTCNFISYTLTRAVDITVVIPSLTMPEVDLGPNPTRTVRHNDGAKYPVLYLLHGFGNNHMTWAGYTNVEFFAEERNMAVVMISAENGGYINQEGLNRYYDFVNTELPDFVGKMFPISERPEDTYIAGLSMGGMGAAVHGFSNPEKYAAIGIFSMGIMPPEKPFRIVPEEYDSYQLAKKYGQEKHDKKMPVFLACGMDDFLYENALQSKDVLAENGFDVTWVPMAGYKHEWRFWNLIVEQFLDWIPRTDALVPESGKRVI